MWDMCQMLNIWHISHTKHKKQLPIRYCICCKIIPFVFVLLQICNDTDRCGKPKIIILFDFSLSSHFFIWFSLSLFRICLSLFPKFLTRSSSSHNQMRARRRWKQRPIIVILHNHHLSQPQPPPQQQNLNPKKPNKPTTTPPYLNPQPPLATKLNQIHSNKTQILQQNLNPKNL